MCMLHASQELEVFKTIVQLQLVIDSRKSMTRKFGMLQLLAHPRLNIVLRSLKAENQIVENISFDASLPFSVPEVRQK